MTTLSRNVRRLPYAFYALAVFMGLFRFYNEWMTFELTNTYGDDGPMAQLAKMAALYWALSEAAYMVGTGAMLQILIAIFDKVKGEDE
jgi:hypothetical protein